MKTKINNLAENKTDSLQHPVFSQKLLDMEKIQQKVTRKMKHNGEWILTRLQNSFIDLLKSSRKNMFKN
jgi:hypothetical protein